MGTDSLLHRFAGGAASDELLRQFVDETNPFCTPQYAGAMASLGYEVWIVGADSRAGAALGFIRRGRLTVTLEFVSLPVAAAEAGFWAAVDRLIRTAGVTDVTAGTFGSPHFVLPALKGELSRRSRQEFVLRLAEPDAFTGLSTNHKRNITKAGKAGVAIRRTQDPDICLNEHLRLMEQSGARRSSRGESVAMDLNESIYRAFLIHGAGELFQAHRDGEVLSSVLVLKSARCAYYQSAGSSPDGMSVGASPFLIHAIGRALQAEGYAEFNLGGAPEGSTLARFKQGFGAQVIQLEAGECYVGPAWRRRIRQLVTLVKSDPQHLRRIVTGSSMRLLVFGAETGASLPVVSIADATFEALTEEQLRALPNPPDDSAFSSRQLERLKRFGRSYAYAVYVERKLAHVAWLLPPEAVAAEVPQVLQLQDGEAEITACETLPSFRGKGIYGYAIHQLIAVARNSGIRRIYMKTTEANAASQSGIRKAGLQPIGSVRIIHPPLRPSRTIVKREIS